MGVEHPFVPLLERLLSSLETTTASSPADIPVVAMVVLGLAEKPCCS